jgi:hypothetical protein
MQCFEERERKHEREKKNLCCESFSDKYDFALFKYPIKFVKFLIISLKRLNKFSI